MNFFVQLVQQKSSWGDTILCHGWYYTWYILWVPSIGCFYRSSPKVSKHLDRLSVAGCSIFHKSGPSVPDITSARQKHLYPRYFWLRFLQWEEMETHHPSLFMSVVWSPLRSFLSFPLHVSSLLHEHTHPSEGGKCPLWCIKAASCMWNTIKFPEWQTFRNPIKVKKCTMKTRLLINSIPHPLLMGKMKSKAFWPQENLRKSYPYLRNNSWSKNSCWL